MTRRYPTRLLGASLSAVLVALTMLAAPAFAGNTREIYIGDPGGAITYTASGAEAYGTLSYSQTSPGGLTFVDIEIRNDGGQTVNHASLLGGYAADTAPVNTTDPAFAPPSYQSLADGLTFVVTYPGAPTCVIGPDGDGVADRSLDCELGTLTAYSSQTFRVVIRTSGTTEQTFPTWFGVYLNEGNATGSNQDNFYATGNVVTTIPTCSTDPSKNKDANYFLATDLVTLASSSCDSTGPLQNAAISSGSAVGGNGTYGEVSLTSLDSQCADIGFTCYGSAVEAHVLDGGPVPGLLQWTVRWYGVKSLSGVIHFFDTYIAGDPVHGNDYTVITFKKQDQCSATKVFDCWTMTSFSKGNDPTGPWFEATVITPNNGRIGGSF